MFFVCLCLDMIVEVFRFGKRRQLAQLESCSTHFHRIIDLHFRASPFLVFKANFVPPFKCSSPSDARCYRILPSPFKNENEPYTEEMVRFSMLLKNSHNVILLLSYNAILHRCCSDYRGNAFFSFMQILTNFLSNASTKFCVFMLYLN